MGPGLISWPFLFVSYARSVVLGVQNVLRIVSQWKRRKTYALRFTTCTSRSWHERERWSWLSIGIITLEIRVSAVISDLARLIAMQYLAFCHP